jgi:hypothetical protein
LQAARQFRVLPKTDDPAACPAMMGKVRLFLARRSAICYKRADPPIKGSSASLFPNRLSYVVRQRFFWIFTACGENTDAQAAGQPNDGDRVPVLKKFLDRKIAARLPRLRPRQIECTIIPK